jgi:hypothetical protein
LRSRRLASELPFPQLNQDQGAPKLMRLDQVLSRWAHHSENLRKKWLRFSGGIMEAISEEEMKMCREELDERIILKNHRGDSRGAARSMKRAG